ncbi:MAG TPA: AAA family ATPase [Draconibacterium sp.]|nr:AAA family ATPase [Draconibacterium sp.]
MRGFYNREKEIELLQEIFLSLKGPNVVGIKGVSGTGKTRLVQEFYNKISEQNEYWLPERNTIGKKELELICNFNGYAKKTDWVIFSARSIERVKNLDLVFNKIRYQFSIHLPQIINVLSRKGKNKKIAKSAISVLMNFAVPGSGNIVDILNSVKDLLSDSFDFLQFFKEIIGQETRKNSISNNEVFNIEVEDLVKLTKSVFREIFKANHDFKIILYFEDSHWIDSYSIKIITELIKDARLNSWNLLILISFWPKNVFPIDAQENKTIKSLEDWFNSIEEDKFLLIPLVPLDTRGMDLIIMDRLPLLNKRSKSILIDRCKGDIDFLHDLIDEIVYSPGWLNNNGQLAVSNYLLNTLPAKSIEMAKLRLKNIEPSINEHLCWGALQGFQFDQLFHDKLINEFKSGALSEPSLEIASEKYRIVKYCIADVLRKTYEFNRAVYFEVCRSYIERYPNSKKIKLSLAAVIAELVISEAWKKVSILDKPRIISTFVDLIKETGTKNKRLNTIKLDLLAEFAQYKLRFGDFFTAINICNEIVLTAPSDKKNLIFSILAEAYYASGEIEMEREVFGKWEEANIENNYLYDIHFARFLRRNSQPNESLKYIQMAKQKTTNKEALLNANIEEVKSLWSNGLSDLAYVKLKELDKNYKEYFLNNESAKLTFELACCLVLHDLDKNRQVINHANQCIQGYKKIHSEQMYLVSRVNYADGLWALGYITKAEEYLMETYEINKEFNLPHISDISQICLANVLSEKGEFDRAAQLYDEGIKLAKEIGHDWDWLYGEIYSCLNQIRQNIFVSKEKILELITLTRDSNYRYLAELSFALLYVHLRSIKDVKELIDIEFNPSLPISRLIKDAVLIEADIYSEERIENFIHELGQVEGIKFYREFIISVVKRIINQNLVTDLISKDFLTRWINSYSPQIELDETTKLVRCNFKSCEARCCYDGVYLENGEEEMIKDVVVMYPSYFKHLPETFIVDGKWNSVVGRKTNVRPHIYMSPDFPTHFNQTRCVFALEDGACSLQKASMNETGNPWTYKPKACKVHPLQTKKGEFFAPPISIEKDKNDVGINYPGYVSYTPCGVNRTDGENWLKALEDEIQFYLDEYNIE